tara:strand:- start:46 stop:246 length:201 start_codon:yes stop_codon:yes gene_type:complete
MMQIKNEYDAFVKAIVLAIEAPTDEKCEQAAELAKGFAKNLSDSQIELGKEEAVKIVGCYGVTVPI